MSAPIRVTAYGIVTALGAGRQATLDALMAGRTGLAEGVAGGPPGLHVGRATEADEWPLAGIWSGYDCRNNRLADRALATDGFQDAAGRAARRYGADRVAVFVGTSTSGIDNTEAAYAALDGEGSALPSDFPWSRTHRASGLAEFVRARLGLTGATFATATACSSSAHVFAQAARAITAGLCDAAVVGGVDTLCRTTLYGFHSLELTALQVCRPFAADRDGMCIGEAGAFALLECSDDPRGAFLAGYGESTDAHHMSTPHPEAAGARRAIRGALRRAGIAPQAVDYVNAHATGTRLNDRAEAFALGAELGGRVPVAGTKGWTGHTLGAAGAVEALLSIIGLEEGLAFGTLHTEQVDPELACHVLTETEQRELRYVLSTSFGFGGNNCALLFGRGDG